MTSTQSIAVGTPGVGKQRNTGVAKSLEFCNKAQKVGNRGYFIYSKYKINPNVFGYRYQFKMQSYESCLVLYFLNLDSNVRRRSCEVM